MDGIDIKTLRESDSEAIAFVGAYLAEHWNVSSEEIERDYVQPSFQATFPYIFIAFGPNREIYGQILLIIEKEGYLGIDSEPWITGLYIPEEFRNRGLAQKLIKAAEEKCRENGYSFLYLDTAQAAGYYRHIGGWEELGTTVYEETGQELTIMKKSLG